MSISILRKLFDEVARNNNFHPSDMHNHVTARQDNDLVDLPALLASTAPLRIPRVGLRVITVRQDQSTPESCAQQQELPPHSNLPQPTQPHPCAARPAGFEPPSDTYGPSWWLASLNRRSPPPPSSTDASSSAVGREGVCHLRT